MATMSDNVVLEYKLQNRVEVRGLASCMVIGYGLLSPPLVVGRGRARFPRQGWQDFDTLKGVCAG